MTMAGASLLTKSSPDVATRKSLENARKEARSVIGKVRQDYKCHLTDFDKEVSERLEELTRKADDILDKKEAEAGDKDLKDIQEEIEKIRKLVNTKLKHQREESPEISIEPFDSKGKAQFLQDPEFPSKWAELDMKLENILEIAAKEYKLSNYKKLHENLKNCLLCLSIFPQGAIIKKRTLIYWWIGEGFANATADNTAEEVGEDYFSDLVNGNWIDPIKNRSSNIIRECTMDPWVRWLVIFLARDEKFFDLDESGTPSSNPTNSRYALLMKNSEPSFRNLGEQKPAGEEGSSSRGEQKQSSDQEGSNRGAGSKGSSRRLGEKKQSSDQESSRRGASPKEHSKVSLMSVFNVDAERLSAQDLFETLKMMKSLQVLQLGRWKTSAEHHIEFVDEESESMHKLTLPRSLRYLSLVGISRITKLPDSIRYLLQLKVLDLGNCQNLEKLGKGIIYLKSLTHLDVSQCYLLDHIPQGLGTLSQLEVLKGFIFGSSRSNDFCQLAELTKLKKLKKLSISVGSEARVHKEELIVLREISGLRSLSITWGRLLRTLSAEERGVVEEIWTNLRYPSSLEKLDLQCYPKGILRIEEKLQMLKKLYIRGGKVQKLHIKIESDPEVGVNVEMVRLKFLKHLEMEWSELREWFPKIEYVQIHECPNVKNVPDELDSDHVWIKEAPSSKPEISSRSPEVSEDSIVPPEATDCQTLSDNPAVLPEATTVTDAAPIPTLETLKTDSRTDVPPDAPTVLPEAGVASDPLTISEATTVKDDAQVHSLEAMKTNSATDIPSDAPPVLPEASKVSEPLTLSEAPNALPVATSAPVHSLETMKTDSTTDVPHSPENSEAPLVPSEAVTVPDPLALPESPNVLADATTVKDASFPNLETTNIATTIDVPPHPSTHSETPIALPEAARTTDVTPGLDTKKSTATTDAAPGISLHTSDLATSNASDQRSGAISEPLVEDIRPTSVPDDTMIVSPTSLVKTTTINPLTNSDPPPLSEAPIVPSPSKDSGTSSTTIVASPSIISDSPGFAAMANVPSHPPVTPSTSAINDPTPDDAASTTTTVAPTVSPHNSSSFPSSSHQE